MSRVRRANLESETEGVGKVYVTVVPFKGSGPITKEEQIAVHKFVTDPAYIRVSAGVTKSTGDYESLRVDVAVTLPCYVEQIDEEYKRLSDYVAEKLDSEISAYLTDD